LKLFSNLQQDLTIVKTFSDDIWKEFGLDKCATAVLKHSKLTKSHNISVNNRTVISNTALDEPCKYLGIEEGDGIDNNQMKDKLMKEYYHPIWQFLKTELNLKNKIKAINMLAIPFLVYSFVMVKWLRKVVEKIDWKTRNLLTIEGIHHPKADVGLYIKRQDGGHGLVELKFT
jgi:hypothetical protein